MPAELLPLRAAERSDEAAQYEEELRQLEWRDFLHAPARSGMDGMRARLTEARAFRDRARRAATGEGAAFFKRWVAEAAVAGKRALFAFLKAPESADQAASD